MKKNHQYIIDFFRKTLSDHNIISLNEFDDLIYQGEAAENIGANDTERMTLIRFLEKKLIPNVLIQQQFCLIVTEIQVKYEDLHYYDEISLKDNLGKLLIGKFPFFNPGSRTKTDIDQFSPSVIISCCTDSEFEISHLNTQTVCKEALETLSERHQGKCFQVNLIDQTTDFETDDAKRNFSVLFEAVSYLDQALKNQKNGLIHCNEGKGRSFMVALLYLSLFGNFASVEEAAKHINVCRPQTSKNPKRRDVIGDWVNLYNQGDHRVSELHH